MNLVEYGPDQFRWSYPWLTESVGYFGAAAIEDELKRAEAISAISAKLQEIAEATANADLPKSDELMAVLVQREVEDPSW